ncbi:hypothetical protein JXB01_00170, partial [Candidatus Micrarchaeota archaeon]|nr:hypothetical protein [Candidatus Micrarchaeota archaeon]
MASPFTPDPSLIVGVALLAMAGIVSIVYMVGSALQNDKVKAWARIELFEIFFSVVILVMLISMIPTFEGITENVAVSMYPAGGDAAKLCGRDLEGTNSPYAGLPCHLRLSKFFLSRLFDEAVQANFAIYNWYTLGIFFEDITIDANALWEQRAFVLFNPF